MIYKDLKADNVLLFSADPNQVPNVKLTDYGIASEDMPGVEVGGIEGTPGFQAPEVLLCGTLSAKVGFNSCRVLTMHAYSPDTGQVPGYRNFSQLLCVYLCVNNKKILEIFPYFKVFSMQLSVSTSMQES